MVAFFTPVMMPPLASASATYTVLGSATSSSSASSHTFFTVLSGSYGYVVAAVSWLGNGASRTLSSATIGGNAATIMVQINESTSFTGCALLIAVGTGMVNTDVVLNMSGATNRWGAQAYGISSLISATPSASPSNSGALPKIASVTSQAGGFVFNAAAASGPATYSGSGGFTQDYTSGNLTPGQLYAGSVATPTAVSVAPSLSSATNGSICTVVLK